MKCLKKNWFFPISAAAFFSLNMDPSLGYFLGMVIAIIISLVAACQFPSMLSFIRNCEKKFCVIAFLTALGICWGGRDSFYAIWSLSSKIQKLEDMLPVSVNVAALASILGAVLALFFVFFCLLLFYREISRIFSDNDVFCGISVMERNVYSILIVVSLVLVVIFFIQTEAFYGTEYAYDVIYTSDSPSLVKDNVYLFLTHPENDLRQPLFAVFAAPFIGIPYLLGKLFGASAPVQAIMINAVQVLMLYAANFMLTKMMKLASIKRLCFMVFVSCTYTHMLFILMMEQYIIAYFWLILCIYLIAEKRHFEKIALWGAGGTLLTSMILLPFFSENSMIRNWKKWFIEVLKNGLGFVVFILAFCRFDVIFNLSADIASLRGFAGQRVTMMDRIYQYTAFVRDCFMAPDAGVNYTAVNHVSWQLNPVENIDFIGVVILLLIVVSVILNRSKRSSLLAFGWIVFSVFMLLGVGWGTNENGLILYSLYYGWAFLVLLFQLLEKIVSKLNGKYFVLTLSFGFAVVLAIVNVFSIIEMVNFAVAYFPV